ncbi:MAG: adenylyl-sulfate kinase [Caldilineales bacterium]|nr:adenylyl-sulfate kinase [Caldilineales bacterium]
MNTLPKGFTIWFTGLSGAGKSTLADYLYAELHDRRNLPVEIWDGDVVRTHLSKGLGFSKEDRDTNILRIGFVCAKLSKYGVINIAAAISPYRDIRDQARAMVGADQFVEVFVDVSLETAIERDVKGLYLKALNGEIKNFTGVSDPYEPPLRPEVVVNTRDESVAESAAKIIAYCEQAGLLPTA